MKNYLPTKFALAVLPALVLAACGSGGNGSDDIDSIIETPSEEVAEAPVDTTAPEQQPEQLLIGSCPLVGNLQSAELGENQCQISGVLLEEATLTSDIEWYLEGGFVIGSDESSARLTIEGGTVIRGDNVDTTDYVLVYPGSSIEANGTGSSPVYFMSDDDNVDGSGEWGGLFLRGFIGTDNEGAEQGDNLLDYVVVAEAGASSTVTVGGQTTTYSDNIVVNGVDESTRLTFVQYTIQRVMVCIY